MDVDDLLFRQALRARRADVLLADHVEHARPREARDPGERRVAEAEDREHIVHRRHPHDLPRAHPLRDVGREPLQREDRCEPAHAQRGLQQQRHGDGRQGVQEEQEQRRGLVECRVVPDGGLDADRDRQDVGDQDREEVELDRDGESFEDELGHGPSLVDRDGRPQVAVERIPNPKPEPDDDRLVEVEFLLDDLVAKYQG